MIKQANFERIPLGQIKVPAGFNARHETPEYKKRVKALSESMLTIGFDEARPLTVKPIPCEDENGLIEGPCYELVDGFTRMAALRLANSKKAGIEDVPCMVQSFEDGEERLELLVKNNGQDLTLLEKGDVYLDLITDKVDEDGTIIKKGMDRKVLAKATGVSVAAIGQALILAQGSPDFRTLVITGKVSATTALEAVQKFTTGSKRVPERDYDAAVDFLKKAIEKAEAQGKEKATAKQTQGGEGEGSNEQPEEGAGNTGEEPKEKPKATRSSPKGAYDKLQSIIKDTQFPEDKPDEIVVTFKQEEWDAFCALLVQ